MHQRNQSPKKLPNAKSTKKVILWSDPAPMHHPERSDIMNSSNYTSDGIYILKNNLRSLWSNWMKIHGEYEESGIMHVRQPFFLCEIKSFLIDPSCSMGDTELLKCSLVLGKLNLELDHGLVFNATLLFRQVQHFVHRTDVIGIQSLSSSSSFADKTTEIRLEDSLEFYTNRMKVAIFSIIPDKNIQVGAHIAGTCIRMSSQRENFPITVDHVGNIDKGNGGYCAGVDVGDIDFVIWPTSKVILSKLMGKSGVAESGTDFIWLRELQLVETPKAHGDESFVSHGCIALNVYLKLYELTAFVSDLRQDQQFLSVGPMSITSHSSIRRDYICSLFATENVLSMVVSGLTTGAAALICTNYLWEFIKVAENFLSLASPLHIDSNDFGILYAEDFLGKLISYSKKVKKKKIIQSRGLEKTMISKNTAQVQVDTIIEFESIDVIFIDSQRHVTGTQLKSDAASSSGMINHSMSLAFREMPVTDMFDLPDYGLGVFIQKPCIKLSWEEKFLRMVMDLSGVQSVIFRHQILKEFHTNVPHIKGSIYQSLNHLYEFSLSYFIFSLYAGSQGSVMPSSDACSSVDGSDPGSPRTLYTVEEPRLDEGSSHIFHPPNFKLETIELLAANNLMLYSGCGVLVDIRLGDMLMVEYSMKILQTKLDRAKKLKFSVCVSEEHTTVNCKIQGGYIFLETLALATFVECLEAYSLLISTFSQWIFNVSQKSSRQAEKPVFQESLGDPTDHCDLVHATTPLYSTSQKGFLESKSNSLKDLAVDIPQFSFILAVQDGSGGFQTSYVEVGATFNLMNFGRKVLFDLYRLTIFTEYLYSDMFHGARDELPALGGIHSKHATTSLGEILTEDDVFESSHSGNHSYILKHLAASALIENLDSGDRQDFLPAKSYWAGKGSVSGFDMTITLSEIQMLLDLAVLLSGVSSGMANEKQKQNIAFRNQGQINSPDYVVPDGAIVTIKDLHQHLYFAVEAVGRKYRLVGTLHYSLVGERALFRVSYYKRWGSRASSFSLLSLYAKNDEGEPLRLNFCPGSDFVEISSSDDKSWAQWQFYPYMSDNYEDDNVVESYGISVKNALYLVNKKNNSAVAFVDGRPEFVKKPGNPLKAKVINRNSQTIDIEKLDVSNKFSSRTSETNVQGGSFSGSGEESVLENNPPHINITIDSISLTILHEVSDKNHKMPLLQSCINDMNIIGQVLPSKFRIISLLNFATHYFDAQKDLWRELISPIHMCLLYHSRFTPEGSLHQKVPVHFYFRMKQVVIHLTTLSLDVLLYIVGKLNLAGPYAIRSSIIFGNCCKLENQSVLRLICHFADNQEAIIPGKQSSSVLLSYIASSGQHPESQNLVSVSLVGDNAFATSPITLSLSKPAFLAWRTRILSHHDAGKFPGPFIVLEVSKNSEEGLSLVVTPLLRIHNESGFRTELRFRRPQEDEAEAASVMLRTGDTIDDCMASFDALKLSGGSKRALMSLTLGNFLLSIRPDATEYLKEDMTSVSTSWSEELTGEKSVRVSGILDKLNYKLRKTFGIEATKSFFSIVSCPINVEGQHVSNVHFLIETLRREVPVIQPENSVNKSETMVSPVALQVQKEIFIYPTIQVYNFLQSDIQVLMTENQPDIDMASAFSNFGKQAIIPCGSNAYFYANPDAVYFTVTLIEHCSKCRPVNSGDCVKKLHKQKNEAQFIDIELDFDGGKYFASLRLSCGERGILEATIFSCYVLQNNTDLPLFCYASSQKFLPWTEIEAKKDSSNFPPHLGCLLQPMSCGSWFLKSNKVNIKCLGEKKTSEALLNLDILSGFTELSLEGLDAGNNNHILKLGVSLHPKVGKAGLPSQLVCIAPRYLISNESKEPVIVRQCHLEDELSGVVLVQSKQKATFWMKKIYPERRKINFFQSILEKHKSKDGDSLIFVQFSLKEMGYGWSGPICVSSLGRFFLKFRRTSADLGTQSDSSAWKDNQKMQFAAVHIVEESSSLYLHFYRPPNFPLPYRIENCMSGTSIMYHQKDFMESDLLLSGDSVEYAWDDLNLPHKLVVQIVDMNVSREINIDKVCTWKPFFKIMQNKGPVLPLATEKRSEVGKRTTYGTRGLELFMVGYEVFTDGFTRVLRICERPDGYKKEKVLLPSSNMQFRVSYFAIHLLENGRQDARGTEPPDRSTLILLRFENIALDSLIADDYKYNHLRVQVISVDEKWEGAPFASMIRGSHSDPGLNEDILRVVFVLQSTNSKVKQVKYSSIVLQPIDLNVDEETLMRLVPFWRTSVSDPTTRSQQFYFKHFEIHPIMIKASFLPGNPDLSYSSTQETLRSFLHSVVKVPTVKNTVVQLNGVLLTHALVTSRELLIKCAKHYSWYVIRGVYMAKGSQLLPPAFASIFDDMASSSLDVFFDPSDGSINLPGITLGMFKFISMYAKAKGLSGTKRYFGDLGKTMKMAGSNALFAALTEISDNVLSGAETNGFNGMVTGFHQGILRLAMEPTLLGAAIMEGGPDRKIELVRSPGVDEQYIEGYLQAMLDTRYQLEFLRVRVVDDLVYLKNLPPNTSVINEIVENVKSFLVSKNLLEGDGSTTSHPFRHLRAEHDWRLGPAVLTLCEHLFVHYAIHILHQEASKFFVGIRLKTKKDGDEGESPEAGPEKHTRKQAVVKFVLSGIVAYMDGRLCRHIPNPIARRIVSGFLLSFLDQKRSK
ncbi:Vacuolar protein sorting-associated protein 13 [Dioscorea alata]|uniref:Vacuolar protein sorting-associated protein 13 n=1 Tax=Dioscorea alata TaxID=55571 RepID=A0ACB7VHI6_DIOAL|nr:Vacuolar protein sorting-associated protein 13 [Dioscorea alata]